MELPEKLKLYRQAQHLTQSQVALELNVSRKTISGWENAHSTPDIATIAKLSDIYHVPLDSFIKDNNFSCQNSVMQSKKATATNRITYFLNFFVILLLCLDLFNPYGFHSFLILFSAIINSFAFISSFQNWSIFSNIFYLLKTCFLFTFIFTTTIFISLFDKNFLNYFKTSNADFLFGLVTGRLVLISLLAFCLIIICSFKRNL